MPIRFVCPYCERLLSISRRKIGSVIECPICRGQVGVPLPDGSFPGPAPSPSASPALLASAAGYTLSTGRVIGLFLLALLALVAAFVAGVLLGGFVI